MLVRLVLKFRRAIAPGLAMCTWIGPRFDGNSEPSSGYWMVVDPEAPLSSLPSEPVSNAAQPPLLSKSLQLKLPLNVAISIAVPVMLPLEAVMVYSPGALTVALPPAISSPDTGSRTSSPCW